MEKPLEAAGVGLQVGRGEVSENHWGRASGVSQGDGDSDMAATCGLWGAVEGSSKEQWLCPTAVWEKAVLRPAMKPDNAACGSLAMLPQAGL